MRVLIDIGHPAHVHMFHRFASVMQQHGHEVLFTCRDKEFEIILLRHYGFSYVNFGHKHKSVCGKIWDLIRFDWNELWVALRFKPDVFVSHGSITASHVAWMIHKPHVTFEDTFNMEQVRLYLPFTKTIITSSYPNPLQGNKVLRYPGYKELMSLHPHQFVPDPAILNELGVSHDDKYVIVRFVGWNATHDHGHHGMTLENKIRAVKEFSRYAKVFISSEGKLPTELEAYRAPINPAHMHHAEAFAALVFGESSTMVAEGAVLGVPGIFMDDTGRLFTKQLEEDYQLCYNLSESPEDQDKAIQLGIDILRMPNARETYQSRRAHMLADKIDVTAWLTWFIENYPASVNETKKADCTFWQRFM